MNIARSAVRSRRVAIASALSILTVASFQAVAAGVRPLVDFSRPEGGPFPSDVFTGFDLGNLTYLRMSLPAPDCTQFPSDCDTIARLNELDGFGLQPRLS